VRDNKTRHAKKEWQRRSLHLNGVPAAFPQPKVLGKPRGEVKAQRALWNAQKCKKPFQNAASGGENLTRRGRQHEKAEKLKVIKGKTRKTTPNAAGDVQGKRKLQASVQLITAQAM